MNCAGKCAIVVLGLTILWIGWLSCAPQKTTSAPPIPATNDVERLREAWQSCENELAQCVQLCPVNVTWKAQRE